MRSHCVFLHRLLWLFTNPCLFIPNTYRDASTHSQTLRTTPTYEFEGYLRSRKGSEASRTEHESYCSTSYSLTSQRQKSPLVLCSGGGPWLFATYAYTNLSAASSTVYALCILQHDYCLIHHEGDTGTRLVRDISDVGHFNYSN